MSMSKTLFILNDPPYGTERTRSTLDELTSWTHLR
jgi:sulfur relay (sulfurtransferase) DsrF/TusC family protein